jgi:hypothetical protein
MQLFAHTQKAWPLLHADGSITTEIVHSVRVPTATANPSPTWRAALRTTVTRYLMTYAIRITDDYGFGEETAMHGVEWNSSWSSIGRGGQIRTDDPLLPKQMRYQAALRPDFLNLTAPAYPTGRAAPLFSQAREPQQMD